MARAAAAATYSSCASSKRATPARDMHHQATTAVIRTARAGKFTERLVGKIAVTRFCILQQLKKLFSGGLIVYISQHLGGLSSYARIIILEEVYKRLGVVLVLSCQLTDAPNAVQPRNPVISLFDCFFQG